LLVALTASAAEQGTLTPNPNPIAPNQSVTISYDGTGTNFDKWTPQCFIHVWLVPKTGMTFTGNYAPDWAACNGDADYANIDAKYKMTYSGTAGKYTITIPNLCTFFGVLDDDKTKIDKFGVIVRAQYTGENNQTIDFLLPVSEVQTNLDKQVSENPKIQIQNNQLSISMSEPSHIEIFTSDGKKVFSKLMNGIFTETLNNGLYILKINNKAQRVLVK